MLLVTHKSSCSKLRENSGCRAVVELLPGMDEVIGLASDAGRSGEGERLSKVEMRSVTISVGKCGRHAGWEDCGGGRRREAVIWLLIKR